MVCRKSHRHLTRLAIHLIRIALRAPLRDLLRPPGCGREQPNPFLNARVNASAEPNPVATAMLKTVVRGWEARRIAATSTRRRRK